MSRLISIVLLGLTAATSLAEEPATLDEARQLWQTGKYAEGLDAFDALAKALPEADAKTKSRIALGRADCLASQGEYDKAVEALTPLATAPEPSADVLARLAEIQLGRGLWDDAEANARRALKVDPDHLATRWVVARLDEARGQNEQALKTCQWIVDRRNARAAEFRKNADALVIVGQAAERNARARFRGEELADELNTVINEIYEAALEVDPRCWQAAWLEGRLFLAGYREGSARQELFRALKINPQAAEVIVTLGQVDLQGYKLADGRRKGNEALEINPHFAPAHVLLVDLNISDERFDDALKSARKAVAENPRDQDALARLAASYRLLVNPVGAFAAEQVALASNPRPSTFYAALGERLADRRKYLSAERAFLLATVADPERADARIGLGMLYMQVGREDEAQALFAAAFDADPFNVRAFNQMKVLKHMTAYRPVTTDHFSVLVEPKQDALLGKYMS
ncbi:MAG: tetratricopeptide repeat protein, partial [Isosphaeraceae bacterium]